MIQAILFDLDDTLYPEREFALSGYRAVAREAAASGECAYEEAFECMKTAFCLSGRKTVFPCLLERFPNLSMTLEEMVRVYREHIPEISLFPGYGGLLEELGKKYRLGIITDGLSAVQRGKVAALGIEGFFQKIIYSWDYGKERQKPHIDSFALMLEALGTPPESAVFIGDNPEKDGLGARGAGMCYVRVATPENTPPARTFPDEIVIENLLRLPQTLIELTRILK
ncbi:MAG: HAD family hydrolase [Acidobacteriota bacterium]|jgi:putative hydrolase of the HAD superfamily|nr:HAD family hydrolase [Acidobacteriota bacterium]